MKRHAFELVLILGVVALGMAFFRPPKAPGPNPQQSAQQGPINAEALRHYVQGAKLAESGEFRQAIDAYSRALTVLPNYVLAYLGRGRARLAGGDPDGALADFNQGISRLYAWKSVVSPQLHNDLYLDRARLELVRGDFTAALQDSQEVLGEYVRSEDVAACALAGLGKPQDALTRLRAARKYADGLDALLLGEESAKMGFLAHLSRLERAQGNKAQADEVRADWEYNEKPSPHGAEGPCHVCRLGQP